MRGKQTMFFALSDDLLPVLEEIERDFDIEYVLMGRFEANHAERYSSLSEVPNIGMTDWGSWAGLDRGFMIIPKDSLCIEEFPLSKGGAVFLVDPKMNPASIELTTGGIYTKKGKVLVAGRVATISDVPYSVALYKALSSKIKKRFKRIGVFYVGPKAEEKLNERWRLVTDVKSPREYDLAYST